MKSPGFYIEDFVHIETMDKEDVSEVKQCTSFRPSFRPVGTAPPIPRRSPNTRRILHGLLILMTFLTRVAFGQISGSTASEYVAWLGGAGAKNMGTGPSNSFPAVRAFHNMFADPQARCFYIFGGHGLASGTMNRYNDVWSLNMLTKSWSLIALPANAQGSYGSKGVPCSTCFPPSRSYAAGAFDETAKIFYIFGGQNGRRSF